MEYFETFVNLLGVVGTKNVYCILPDALKYLCFISYKTPLISLFNFFGSKDTNVFCNPCAKISRANWNNAVPETQPV
jgi:hypothetical protein